MATLSFTYKGFGSRVYITVGSQENFLCVSFHFCTQNIAPRLSAFLKYLKAQGAYTFFLRVYPALREGYTPYTPTDSTAGDQSTNFEFHCFIRFFSKMENFFSKAALLLTKLQSCYAKVKNSPAGLQSYHHIRGVEAVSNVWRGS